MDLNEYSLPDPDVDDLALDFIEQKLGRFFFIQNWKRLRKVGQPVASVRKWLVSTGRPDKDAVAIVHRIECLARADAKWSS